MQAIWRGVDQCVVIFHLSEVTLIHHSLRHRFSVCCPPGMKQVWGSGLLSPQHSGYVCLRSRCRPSNS